MKTLKEAQAYHKQVHYRVICEHCHTECVADEEDFDGFFGIPEHAEDERAWRCPICGHVTIVKNQGLLYCVCDEIGRFVAVTPHC
jgi:DNA-directed RNA polymerase subunit RPC12/RpoP